MTKVRTNNVNNTIYEYYSQNLERVMKECRHYYLFSLNLDASKETDDSYGIEDNSLDNPCRKVRLLNLYCEVETHSWWFFAMQDSRNGSLRIRQEFMNFVNNSKSNDGVLQTKKIGPRDSFELHIYIFKPYLDFLGSYIGNSFVSNKCEVETAFSWLSTLGGAFSALGDLSHDYAKSAGEVSMKQLKLAMKLEDPLIASRCRLYAALSLMQLGDLRSSRLIIVQTYNYSKSLPDGLDPKLTRMCLGVWAKLQYLWQNQCAEFPRNELRASKAKHCLKEV